MKIPSYVEDKCKSFEKCPCCTFPGVVKIIKASICCQIMLYWKDKFYYFLLKKKIKVHFNELLNQYLFVVLDGEACIVFHNQSNHP